MHSLKKKISVRPQSQVYDRLEEIAAESVDRKLRKAVNARVRIVVRWPVLGKIQTRKSHAQP